MISSVVEFLYIHLFFYLDEVISPAPPSHHAPPSYPPWLLEIFEMSSHLQSLSYDQETGVLNLDPYHKKFLATGRQLQ